jgi:hypothetical protein
MTAEGAGPEGRGAGGAAAGGERDAGTELRDFKTRSRALPAEQRREAFESDDFRRLVAAAAAAPPVPLPPTVCAAHCITHCGTHCFGHEPEPAR